jgi:hypothetical protein
MDPCTKLGFSKVAMWLGFLEESFEFTCEAKLRQYS